jgi:PBP1b-binding outer membrane lipoprotein LpoB
MKKILFAALAALAITSCSQNEIDGIDNGTPKSKNEIGVNTIVIRVQEPLLQAIAVSRRLNYMPI